MPISRSRPRRPRQRVTPLDAPLVRPVDDSPNWTDTDGQRIPPQWILDRIAEETVHKGFTGKRHQTCPVCFVRKASNGRCNCPSDVDTRKIKKFTTHRQRSPLADALGA